MAKSDVRVAIVYASDGGATRAAARAHAAGVADAGGDPRVVAVEAAAATDLTAADAVILGCPIHMGTPHWRMKRFIDEVCGPFWKTDALAGKVGAAFVTGGGYGDAGGGAEHCLVGLLGNLAQLGLVIAPLPRSSAGYAAGGTPFGPYCRTQAPDLRRLTEDELSFVACRAHGANVARLAERMAGFSFGADSAIAISE